MPVHDFDQQLAGSDSPKVRRLVEQALRRRDSSFLQLHKAHRDNDFAGIDYLGEYALGQSKRIDVKVRKHDWLDRNGQDADLGLEIWSDVDAQTLGWARDPSKQTDLIVWVWLNTGRTYAAEFGPLRTWFSEGWQQLRQHYGSEITESTRNRKAWKSEVCFVPHRIVTDRLSRRNGYVPVPLEPRQNDDTAAGRRAA